MCSGNETSISDSRVSSSSSPLLNSCSTSENWLLSFIILLALKVQVFSPVPLCWWICARVPQLYVFYYMSLHWRWGSRRYHVSCLFCCFIWSLSLIMQFFIKGNCSMCRYKFGMYMGGGEFSLFLLCHLGHLFNCCFKKRYSLDVCASHFNRNYIIGKVAIKSK